MKKIIVMTMLLIVSATSFSQPVTNPVQTTKTDYHQKGKNQKDIAWVLVGGGAVVLSITALANSGIDFTGPKKKSPTVLIGIGAVCMAGSIPLFIASAKNKRKAKAMSASIRMENADVIHGYRMAHTSYPAFTIKISL